MFTTDIGYFCSRHEDWEQVLVEEPYYLKIKEDGPYVMFSYDQIRSDFSYTIVREARGIIFRKGEWEVPVCHAFDKFGNYGESYAPDIDWNTAFVTEKIDGSLIKIWWDNEWHISTNGTIDAFKAELGDARMHDFGYYFLEALGKYYNSFGEFVSGLETHRTYMFELVGPYNRVVVPYDEPDLYFLGARTNASGEEYCCSSIIAGALGLGKFKRPAVYSLTSLEDCIKAAELKTWDDEGFVVCDANFNRVKIKSPAYVLAHFMRNNNVITRKHIIKIILENEVEEFLCYAADYKEELEKVQKLMNSYHNIGNKLAQACRQMILLERKDYAKLVQALPNIFQGLLYMNYDRFVSAQEFTAKWNENKWDEYLTEVEKLNKEILEG
jgi:hypothetical protein